LLEVTDVLFAVVLIFLTGFINTAGQDLWDWLRNRIRRE
jgi:hypothetical protein